MTTETAPLSKSLAKLRSEFDRTFASPPPHPEEERESLICLQVAGQALVVRTRHINSVAKCRRILPIPTHVPGLLGITAIRSSLLPVYDLAALLGLSIPAKRSDWLLITGSETPVAFVFDDLEGQLEIERSGLYESDASASEKHLRLVAKLGTAHRAVIDLPGIVEEIRKTAGVLSPVKE